MALPPLPESNTERWWMVYTVNGATHRLMIRTVDGVTAAQVEPVFFNIWSMHAAALNSTQLLNLERALKGSNVRIPFAYTLSNQFGTGTQSGNDRRARSWSYTGRSTDGRKSRLFIFGGIDASQGDYRTTSAESTIVQTFSAYLNAAASVFLSISGLQPVWHAYLNIGYNDHWIKQFRKGL
jgi:hypothetical protein